MSLALCSSCKRFARIGACPFCGTRIGGAAPSNGSSRMARAALMVVATTAGPFDCATTAPAYGAPPPTVVVTPSAPDAGTISVAAYGAPAPPPSVDIGPITIDSGTATATDASVTPKPKDAGVVQQHRQAPAYGLAPNRHIVPDLDDRK